MQMLRGPLMKLGPLLVSIPDSDFDSMLYSQLPNSLNDACGPKQPLAVKPQHCAITSDFAQ